ncbi:MAG: hypothetical protein AAF958_17905 [Planctomycetota bacterium]
MVILLGTHSICLAVESPSSDAEEVDSDVNLVIELVGGKNWSPKAEELLVSWYGRSTSKEQRLAIISEVKAIDLAEKIRTRSGGPGSITASEKLLLREYLEKVYKYSLKQQKLEVEVQRAQLKINRRRLRRRAKLKSETIARELGNLIGESSQETVDGPPTWQSLLPKPPVN